MAADIDRLARLAAAHHGLFRASEALDVGLTTRQLDRLAGSGWCERPSDGVYRLCGAPRTRHQEILQAAWISGADAVASHRSASFLWGLAPFAGSGPEITIRRGRNQRLRHGTIHGSLWLPDAHRTSIGGIPVTTVPRTVFDVAGVVRAEAAERVLDAALVRRCCTLREVQHVFFALARRGRRGTATMRALLEARGEGYVPPASELERVARSVFSAAGLPTPSFEVDLGDEAWIGRVDCVWRGERVIVELDGRRFHDGRLALDADRKRDNALMAAGWRVIRVTWEDLRERPAEVVRWISRALAAAPAA